MYLNVMAHSHSKVEMKNNASKQSCQMKHNNEVVLITFDKHTTF